MKKIIAIAMCVIGACLTGICEHSRSFMDSGLSMDDNKKENVIPLSVSEWNYVKNTVDTNGVCRIPSCNTYIIVTNGLNIGVWDNLSIYRRWYPNKKVEEATKKEPTSYQN